MNIAAIITAVIVVSAIGLFIGLFLGIASICFRVQIDEREEKIAKTLPGNNCGGCGYPGCSGLAAAIVKGEAPVNGCPVGGAAVGALVAEIMGVENTETVKKVAYVKCSGDCNVTFQDYEYYGEKDCQMLKFVPNQGPKSCKYGCQGFGTCVKACPFDAIHVENGIAVVDKEKCKACGKCVAVCPQNLIEFIPYESKYVVSCSSKEKGPATMKVCKTGCIGCGLCAKNCEKGAIEIIDFHAVIDYSKCIGCGVCEEKCPKNIIHMHN